MEPVTARTPTYLPTKEEHLRNGFLNGAKAGAQFGGFFLLFLGIAERGVTHFKAERIWPIPQEETNPLIVVATAISACAAIWAVLGYIAASQEIQSGKQQLRQMPQPLTDQLTLSTSSGSGMRKSPTSDNLSSLAAD